MTHDCIVVGLKDTSVAQKLQTDHKLMLDKAVTLAKQSEAVKTQQQSIVKPPTIDSSISIEAIKHTQQEASKEYSRNAEAGLSHVYKMWEISTSHKRQVSSKGCCL